MHQQEVEQMRYKMVAGKKRPGATVPTAAPTAKVVRKK